MSKMYDEKVKAVCVRAGLKDFDGDVAKWRDSFYEIWRYQMTWDFAYNIDLHEVSSGDVIVDMYVKKAYKDNVASMMESLGYRNVQFDEEYIAKVYGFEHDELEDVWFMVLDI